MNDHDPEWMTRTEFCQLVRIVPRTARRWAIEGHGPVPVWFGRRPRYRRSEVERFLASAVQRSTEEHQARTGVA